MDERRVPDHLGGTRMAIKKQEFYEGAALHLLIRTDAISNIQYRSPFFVVNNKLLIFFKYSTKGRSPWGFTFMPDEQKILREKSREFSIAIGLICGSDGVVALNYDDYLKVAALKNSAIHVSCYRKHGEYYEVSGPDGRLNRKIPPSDWRKISESCCG